MKSSWNVFNFFSGGAGGANEEKSEGIALGARSKNRVGTHAHSPQQACVSSLRLAPESDSASKHPRSCFPFGRSQKPAERGVAPGRLSAEVEKLVLELFPQDVRSDPDVCKAIRNIGWACFEYDNNNGETGHHADVEKSPKSNDEEERNRLHESVKDELWNLLIRWPYGRFEAFWENLAKLDLLNIQKSEPNATSSMVMQLASTIKGVLEKIHELQRVWNICNNLLVNNGISPLSLVPAPPEVTPIPDCFFSIEYGYNDNPKFNRGVQEFRKTIHPYDFLALEAAFLKIATGEDAECELKYNFLSILLGKKSVESSSAQSNRDALATPNVAPSSALGVRPSSSPATRLEHLKNEVRQLATSDKPSLPGYTYLDEICHLNAHERNVLRNHYHDLDLLNDAHVGKGEKRNFVLERYLHVARQYIELAEIHQCREPIST